MDRDLPPVRAPPPGHDCSGEGPFPYQAFESLDPAAGTEAVREVLDESGPFLDEFCRRVQDYRHRVFPKAGRVRSVRIEDRVVRDRIGHLPVSFLSDRARRALALPSGAAVRPARLVRLSPETAVKQAINHSDLTKRDYRRLPEIVGRGSVFRKDEQQLVFLQHLDRRHTYVAFAKQTRNNEIFLTSFHKIRRTESELARATRGLVEIGRESEDTSLPSFHPGGGAR